MDFRGEEHTQARHQSCSSPSTPWKRNHLAARNTRSTRPPEPARAFHSSIPPSPHRPTPSELQAPVRLATRIEDPYAQRSVSAAGLERFIRAFPRFFHQASKHSSAPRLLRGEAPGQATTEEADRAGLSQHL
ncbi:hypothetical protein MTO96_000834 [Rhipicephalus appendiculatus]